MYKEPYFMKKLHEQRERDSIVLYKRFKGDVEKWWKWMEEKVKKPKREAGPA